MKANNKKYFKLLAITVILIIAVMAIYSLSAGGTAHAAGWEYDPYKLEITKYDIEYDISSDCSMKVKEDLTVHYLGSKSTGIIRDIPVNGGALVQNINVSKLVNGQPESVYYDVDSEDLSFISLDIGDQTNKTDKYETYRITYDYIVPYYTLKGDMLPVNAVVHGCPYDQFNVSVKLILPKGYTGAKCYKGVSGDDTEHPFSYGESTGDGRMVITAFIERLMPYEGLSFDLKFEKGVLSGRVDLAPYIFAGIGVIILGIIIALKFTVFKQPQLIPVTGFEAPENMDPLLVGKLIDYKVNTEDITSLIYYFADKGYLKINLDNQDDPTLIRIVQRLPEGASQHERVMFDGLFKKGDIVKTSDLTYSFYRTAEKVTALVNGQTKYMYANTSVGASVLFAILGGLLAAAAPIILILLRISGSYFHILPLVIFVPGLIIYALSENLRYNALKYSAGKKAGFIALTALVCVLTVLLYMFLLAGAAMDIFAAATIMVICIAIVIASSFLIKRTEKYTKQLGEIVGFKNFITLAEKDRLEKLLADNPQFYYHVLPYAQVLGVSDKWQEKFSGLTVQPPTWATSSRMSLLEFHMINHCLRSSMSRMTAHMVSRPSSSGANGGGHSFGGGGRGFGGGGFGGGGGRGR